LSYAAASGALLSGKDCGNSTSSVNTVEMSLSRYRLRSASFSSLEQLEAYNACADRQFFDLAFVPVREYKSGCGANGVEVPFYCPPGEEKGLIKALESAKKAGARYALCGNPEKAELLRDIGFSLLGDFRLNITNTATGALMREFGFERVILSPELTLPRMRDIPFARSAVVYGRVPLMLLRRCVRKSLIGCRACAAAADKTLWLCDRRGYRFPVLKTGDCMNTVYNSLPHWMGDRKKALEAAGIGGEHFIFSVETGAECAKITGDWLNSKIKSSPVKRINDK